MTVSVVTHVIAAAALLWLVTAPPSKGTVSPEVRSVGMAIAHRMPDRTRYVSEPETAPEPTDVSEPLETAEKATEKAAASEAASSSNSPNPTISPEPANEEPANEATTARSPLGLRPPIDLSKILGEMTGEADASGRGRGNGTDGVVQGRIDLGDGRTPDQLGVSELTPGVARSGRGAGRTTTDVFGITGTGSAFVYVFDRSDSMAASNSAPLRAAKTELIRSLETLTEKQQFQIIFYNHKPDVFRSGGEQTGLVFGEPANIERARRYIQQTTAIGGTEHEAALRMAIRMAPDVIFFLTDAKIQTMSGTQIDDINRRAEDAGTTIHAIQFGTGTAPKNGFLEQLVRKNGGGYRYLDVTALK